MAGFQEDKIDISKNDTFKNTIEDSNHAAFASQCDFYITNDKRNLNKTKQVYQSMGINTIVFTPAELFEFLTNYINSEEERPFLDNVVHKINDWKVAGHEPNNPKRITVYLKDFLLDYFNKAYNFSD